jgi:hypothetical protein
MIEGSPIVANACQPISAPFDRWAPVGLFVVLLACASSAYADPGSARLDLATQRAQALEQSMMSWRLAIAVGALIVVGLPILVRARRMKQGTEKRSNATFETARITALLFLAFAAYSSYYDFFQPKFGIGFKDTDVYHYYMGSKYFSEVGYFDLYHCTLMALVDSGVEDRFDLPEVRDMRTLRMHSPESALFAARECKQQFAPERWTSFTADVAWFESGFDARRWHVTLRDHGYNPSPVWNAIGVAITSRIPLGSAGFDWLIRGDRILIAAAFMLIVWAFGLEVGALSAIAWGTGQQWGYTWIGDSLLRNLWLFALICGLCMLRKKWNVVAGAFLSLSSMLRIFPGIFLLGVFLHAGLRRRLDGRWSTLSREVAVGAIVAGGVLFGWAVVSSAWGAVAFLEFSEKIDVFTDQKSLNKLGVTSLVWRSIMMGTGHMVTGAEGQLTLLPFAPSWLPVAIRGVQLAVVVPALFLYARALKRVQAWEAATLSFALIPLLSDPANYYYGFVVCGALLAGGRPRLQVYILWSCVLWIANSLFFYRVHQEYIGACLIAVLLPLAVLYEMSREAPPLEAS